MTVDLASGPRAAMVGQTVSHYRVLRILGAGGMADVYEAEDLNLGRRVALKFLSSARVPSRQAVQRLEREARAASALNHPHICTIFDIGEHLGDRFIAMERLEGETLRDRLRRGPLDASTLLDVGIQIADALEAAHRAHIVHRDVSPSNVFLTNNHHAKLLDFGLATLEPLEFRPQSGPDEVSTTTEEPLLTTPGAVMGTVAYMSPEQVRGEPVDHRTDLFSFGAVLYEMATGHRAFRGKTSALISDAILHDAPSPARDVNPAVSEGLQTIVEKALEKDRHLRYQRADEIRADLERVRRDEELIHRPPAGRWRVGRRSVFVLVGATILAIAAVAAYRIATRDPSIPQVSRPVTSGRGIEGDPALSPDGQTIAYTTNESGNKDIWIVEVKGGPAQRLTTDDADDTEPTWFPDGRSLAFSSARRIPGRSDVWRAPILDGAAATLFIPDAAGPAVSADGTMIAFTRTDASGYRRVWVAPVADPARARVLTGERDGRWNHDNPAWSPDGRRICYSAWDGLWIAPVGGGPVRRLTTEETDQHPSWSPDGRHIYFVSYVDRAGTIWRITVANGDRKRVTLGSGAEYSPDVSRDGRLIAFASESGDSDLVTIDLSSRNETPLGIGSVDFFPSLGSGGTVVYFVANRWGLDDIWRLPLERGGPAGPPRRVFEQPGDKAYPAVSPDGRWLAYYRLERTSGAGRRRDVWVVSTSGGAPIQVTADGTSIHPSWSPDSSTLAYASERSGTQSLWTQRMVDGRLAGDARNITEGWPHFTTFPTWSPDGASVAFLTLGTGNVDDVAMVSSGGGRPSMVTSGANVARVKWGAAGNLLVAALWGTGDYQLRSIRPDGSPVPGDRPPLVLGKDPAGAMFDVSQDGTFVIVARGKPAGRIWVMEPESRKF